MRVSIFSLRWLRAALAFAGLGLAAPSHAELELRSSAFTILRQGPAPLGVGQPVTRPQFSSLLNTAGGAAALPLAPGTAFPGDIILLATGGTAGPGNLALAGTAFAKDVLPTAPHSIANLNNGTTGNASSWIPAAANSFAGISLGATPVPINRVAFGRDNTGLLSDRSLGAYTLQYTTAPNPGAATPAAAWTTLGTITLGPGFPFPSLRHLFSFPTVQATGLRLAITDPTLAIDEIEIYHSGAFTGYAAGAVVGAPAGQRSVLARRISFGGTFSPGVPLYGVGDEILPPATDAANQPVAPGFWRREPLAPGELVQHPNGTSLTPVAPGTAVNFYYSPHAKRVFAHKAGRVSITWRSNAPVGNLYLFKTEAFNVSSATTKPLRTLYWTKRDSIAPPVSIASSRLTAIKPLFHSGFPATVAAEYDPNGTLAARPFAGTPILGTVWTENVVGTFEIHAYNLEGRIMLEYLGAPQPDGSFEFLGADVVQVERAPDATDNTVKLGERILPRDGDERLQASPVLNPAVTGAAFYASVARGDGTLDYYAERENDSPDRVAFHWQETHDAGIHFLSAARTPGLNFRWVKYFDRYRLVWPSGLGDYVHNLVPAGGSDTATGIRFPGGKLPTIVHQDDVAQTQASLDAQSQRLLVDLGPDALNRTLVKFLENGRVWYVRLYTQSQDRPGLEEGDGTAALGVREVRIGDRIERPSPAFEIAGHIAGGANYLPAAYVSPLGAGSMEQAARGAIIPVNAVPGADELRVWWFQRVAPPDSAFQEFFVPVKQGRYRAVWPAAPRIVLASNAGSGDLSPAELGGSLYAQDNPAAPGYNPNEEHALLIAGRVYALRDDLNITAAAGFTSRPCALLAYTAADGRPAVTAMPIVRETAAFKFEYPATAGTIVNAPMPLPLLPLALRDGQALTKEEAGVADQNPAAGSPPVYTGFTFKDRKGYVWCYRGPHGAQTPSFGLRFWYPMQAGFHIPGQTAPAPGTPLPYLRPLDTGGAPIGGVFTNDPLIIRYRPAWPAQAPTLQIAETLTLAKLGLPAVRGQTSAEVLYQQSIALQGSAASSVTLHDPTRDKTFALGGPGRLQALPPSIATSTLAGKTYFQGLPPHLQNRVFLDPNRGARGTLVFSGRFVDEVAGEDYLHLNVLGAADVAALKDLVPADAADKSAWDAAVDGLATAVQTFVENPQRRGTFLPDAARTVTVGAGQLAAIGSSETAVDSYALTATGRGSGYVTLLFGNGQAFTPEAEPVAVQVIRVIDQLNVGQLKPLLASNPLDEKVTLRHTGDFAARPEDYEFEWRYAPPAGGAAPRVYSFTNTTWAGQPARFTWWRMRNRPGPVPSPSEIAAAPSAFGAAPFAAPAGLVIRDSAYDPAGLVPGVTLVHQQTVDFAGPAPDDIIFSARLGAFDGFVLHVNGQPALSFRAPAAFDALHAEPAGGLAPEGLPLQWRVDRRWFNRAQNTLAVTLHSTADVNSSSLVDFNLHAPQEQDLVTAAGSPWQNPDPANTLPHIITTGGSPSAPLGNPLLVMSDNYFTLRYRPRVGRGHILAPGADQAAVPWSRWMPAVLVEGWIKRALAGINPFNQRTADLFNNTVNTDVSLLTQAGARWEGDVPLSLANINDFGLISIYETLLNRGKNISIDNGYDYAPANDALLLAAGYLSDLYVLLGNEAFADAANPTISVDDASIGEVNTSRFSFEGQVASVLEEELALLRGRDDFLSPGVLTTPAYNRLYWNYTRGINSGEALYAVNYAIKEKTGSPTQDGRVDAADAQRMFPQGHGDAYGHYLTALTGYYRLLTNPNFTWIPRTEAVTVLGQPVQVDYKDERKFAGAAASLAATAQQIVGLVHRQSYSDDPAAGWTSFRDGKFNSQTGRTRRWGLDEWSARAGLGAYTHWIVANALLPDVDNNPRHTGIQKIDRTTVPELGELAATGLVLQATLDNANSRLNPLGLSPHAIAFDISAADLQAGQSHYEQIHDRALRAVLNARGAFNQAASMTRSLRDQALQIENYNDAIFDQEVAFADQLQDLYGQPYPGDIGPGKTYPQGYTGPDLVNWAVIDGSNEIVDTSRPLTLTVRVPLGQPGAGALAPDQLKAGINELPPAALATRTVTVHPSQIGVFSDQWFAGSPGVRPQVGRLQTAISDAQRAYAEVLRQRDTLNVLSARYERERQLFKETKAYHDKLRGLEIANTTTTTSALAAIAALETIADLSELFGESFNSFLDGAAEAVPTAVHIDGGDVAAPARGGIEISGALVQMIAKGVSINLRGAARGIDVALQGTQLALENVVSELGYSHEQLQLIYEFRNTVDELSLAYHDAAAALDAYQTSLEALRTTLAAGNDLQAKRETFRKRAAAIVQGYRTQDLTFRTFRNEALEQYRGLFDLAARYTYLSAKSYDYETGLLGTPQGRSVLGGIVASRALGDLTGDQPQATVSTLGDAGLAGTMARLQADWSVVKGRLGINNAARNSTVFSLRQELFRIPVDAASPEDQTAWAQTLQQHILPNVLLDSDVAQHCLGIRKLDGSPVPGLVIPFSTTIQDGRNFFGLPLAAGDHAYTRTHFSTKIHSMGVVLPGYVGMDSYASGNNNGRPTSAAPNALAATPYVYLIPVGTDRAWAPALGDPGTLRDWLVHDQALPLPFNLGANAFNGARFFDAGGTLTSQPWILRKHASFRPVDDATLFYGDYPFEFTSTRLVGRSVWNTRWKLVIPAHTLLSNEQDGLNRFVATVQDIQLFLRTYSYSGN